jgi:hypothetical protein
VKTPARLLILTLLASVVVLSLPRFAEAQRRAVRVVRPRTTVFVGAYYNPFVYHPFYGSWYYGGYGFGPWYPPYYGYGRGYYDVSAALRLQVSPRETEVFIDGYYAGRVDDFDGVFQRLHLEAGDHDLELYLPGYRSVQQKVYLQPGRTFRVRQVMEPLAAGEAAPVRPSGPPPSSGASRPGPRRPGGRGPERTADNESGFGALALRVQPGDAEVLIDGERWEGSPDDGRLVVQLAPGPHRLEIRKEGYRSYFTDVTIRGRETTTLNVAMTAQ